MKSLCLLMFFLLLISGYIHAQTDSVSIYEMDLAHLTRIKITSASKVAQNISEVPSTIYIITAADIKEKGYFTLDEALSDLPGFQFRNTLGMNSYVFQRGIPNQNNLILVLIDGVQINELNSGGFYGGAQYNLSNIEHIEVIYGPASVAYGTNAVSGIINIITKSPLERQAGINALTGNFKTAASDCGYSYLNKRKTFGLQVAGMLKTSEKADLRGNAGDNNWTDLMDNFENDYSFDIKARWKYMSFGTNYMYKQPSTVTNIRSVGTIYRDYGTSWNIQFMNNYLKYYRKFSGKVSLSSLLYNRNSTVLANTVYYVLDTAQVGYYRPNNLTGLENIFNWDVARFFSLTGGVIFECDLLSEKASYSYSDSADRRPPRPATPVILNNYLISAFAEPRFTLFKNLYMSGGVRYDYSSIYEHVLTPRLGLNYHFFKQIVRISYAEAFRAPKPWDYTDGLGNPGLLPEKMRSLEAAFTFSIIDKFKIDLVGFKNELSNAISKEVRSEGYSWVNSGSINTYGLEVFLRFISRNWKTSLNYSYDNSFNQDNVSVPEISEHTGNASVTYSFLKYCRVNLRANYTGKRKNTKLITSTGSMFIDPCVIFHGAVSLMNYKGFTVQLIMKNILNTRYYHTSIRDPDRYRQPQRTVMFSVGYDLNY